MLRVPAPLVSSTFRVLRECGRGRNECVVYWTGPVIQPDLVNGQDHPVHRHSPGEYEIDSGWLTRYWFCIARDKRAIRAQIHTHPGAAFHSTTDDQFPVVSHPGFISIVIPNFAIGILSLENAWVGRLETDGRWRAVAVNTVIEITP